MNSGDLEAHLLIVKLSKCCCEILNAGCDSIDGVPIIVLEDKGAVELVSFILRISSCCLLEPLSVEGLVKISCRWLSQNSSFKLGLQIFILDIFVNSIVIFGLTSIEADDEPNASVIFCPEVRYPIGINGHLVRPFRGMKIVHRGYEVEVGESRFGELHVSLCDNLALLVL